MVTWFRCPGFREFHAFDGTMDNHAKLSLCGKVPFCPADSILDYLLDFNKACKKCLEAIASHPKKKIRTNWRKL